MEDDSIEIELKLDDGSIEKTFTNLRTGATKAARSIQKGFGRTLTRDISKPFEVAKNSIFSLRTAATGLIAVLGGGLFLRSITQAAIEQEDAVNQLNTSLQTAGTFSQEASESFQDLASELQRQSRFGDEVILQQAALARNYTSTNEEAEALIKTSIDLAEATGTSLDSAVRNLGKTLSGLTGELGEAVPIIRGLTTEQLKAGEAITLLADRFGGAALGATRTFSGALSQLGNQFSDFLEKLGDLITQSPAVIAFFNALSTGLDSLRRNFSGAGAGVEGFIKGFIQGLLAVSSATLQVIEFVIQIPRLIEQAFLRAAIVARQFVTIVQSIFRPITNFIRTLGNDLGLALGDDTTGGVANSIKAIDSLRESLKASEDSAVDAAGTFLKLQNVIDDVGTAFQENLIKPVSESTQQSVIAPVTEAVDRDLEKLRESVFSLQLDTIGAIQDTFFNASSVLADTPSVFEDLSGKGVNALKLLQAELQRTKDQTVALSMQIGQAVRNGIANTIANAVGSVVDALRTGQDAFGAFAKAALATIGDLAIQLGQTLIAAGIGIEALKVLGGTAAIAAGIALVAVGTLIKGAATGGAPGGGGGGLIAPDSTDAPILGDDDFDDPGARVQVNIQGDVFDSDATGIRIADILKDSGFNNAVVT